MKAYLFLFIFILHHLIGYSQLPKTDVYLADFLSLNDNPQLQSVRYLNGFNPNGYNNQVRLINSDELYLTVALDSQETTDIYYLNLKSKAYFRFTATDGISEFSPKVDPTKKRITTVRIERDGVDQSLWSYPEDRSDKGFRLFPTLKNVGYYAWMHDDKVAMFLVGKPHTLAIGDVATGDIEIILENIGRCLKTDSAGNLLFVHKVQADVWMLKTYHPQNKSITNIIQMPVGREDFDILSNGSILITDGSFLKSFQILGDKSWKMIADFAHLGIKNMQRPSVVKERVVFINAK